MRVGKTHTRRDVCVVRLPEVVGHDWRVGADISIEHIEFYSMHRAAPRGWVWIECRDCGVCRMVHTEDAPPRGRTPLPLPAPWTIVEDVVEGT